MSEPNERNLLQGWVDASCSAVTRHDYTWRFDFGAAGGVTVECPWKIISNGRVALTAHDDGQKFGKPAAVDAEQEARSLLQGRRVTKVVIAEITADLRVECESDVVLELHTNSSGYESWQAGCKNRNGGRQVIAMGGGELAIFEQKDS